MRRPRPFGNGDLRLIVLSLIAEAPSHGYELIKVIEDRLGGGYSPSPGIIYPTLTLLEEMGCVSSVPDGAKKLFTVTPAGLAHLEENQDRLSKLTVRMSSFGAANGGSRLGLLTRAMENLKMAIRMRTSRGPLSDDQIAAIRAILDDGAAAIEKL